MNEDGVTLGFAGMVATGQSPEVAWQQLHERMKDPIMRQMIDHMNSTPGGQSALAKAREQWAALGFPAPWDEDEQSRDQRP